MTHNNNKNHRITKNFLSKNQTKTKKSKHPKDVINIFFFFLYICLFFPLFWNSICQIFSPLLEILSKFFFCSKKNQVVTTNSSHQFFCLFSLWFNVKAKVENEINDHYMYTLIIVNNNNNNKRKNNRKNVCVFNIRLSIN